MIFAGNFDHRGVLSIFIDIILYMCTWKNLTFTVQFFSVPHLGIMI